MAAGSEWTKKRNAEHGRKRGKVAAAFHEVHHNVPEAVEKSGKTGEAREKMMTAIALSKARRAGARVPKK